MKNTLRHLCQSIVNRLETHKAISFAVRLRHVIVDEVQDMLTPVVLTDEDLRHKTLHKLGAHEDVLKESGFSDSDQYRSALAVVRSQFGANELGGLYYQKAPKDVAALVASYLMRSSHIDDVYEMDEEIIARVVDVMKTFDPSTVH